LVVIGFGRTIGKPVVALGVAAIALVVTACGGSSSTPPPSKKHSGSVSRATRTTVATTTVTSTPSTQTQPPSTSFVATNTWTWDGQATGGYKASFQFEDSDVTSVSQAPLFTGFTSTQDIVNGCSSFNAETDAVIPAQIEITNTTASFSAKIEAFVVLPNDTDSAIDYVGGQIQCAPSGNEDNPGESAFSFACTLNSGASCTVPFYIAVQNYFSPSDPSGDQTVLANSEIQFCTGGDCLENGSNLALTAPTGPDASLYNGAAGEDRIDIAPL
jgi:hypothetical protein